MNGAANRRMALIAVVVLALDQGTKWIALHNLRLGQEHDVIEGFFKFVLWPNTGAAWSLLPGRNDLLAAVSVAALIGLFYWRRHFQAHTILGQLALGLIFGGIAGNLFDRVYPARHHVIDFLRFYMIRHSGEEIGFPAFNVADSAICVGVALLMLVSWKLDTAGPQPIPTEEALPSKE
jgi:signal peptidase II